MKKIWSLFLVIMMLVTVFLPVWAANSNERFLVEKTAYDYRPNAGFNNYGEINCPTFNAGDKTYLEVFTNNGFGLIDVETGKLVLDNFDDIGRLSEYSDLIYLDMNNRKMVYNLQTSSVVCELANLSGLGYRGHFSEEGGFITLASDQKLHFITNDGIVGNAVDIDYSQYVHTYKNLMGWSYLGEGLYQLVFGSREGYQTIGMVNSDGKVVIFADQVNSFVDGKSIFGKIGKYGTVDKYGVVDKYGKEIIPCQYSSMTYKKALQRYFARKDGISYEIDKTGKIVKSFTPNYDLYDSVDTYLGNGLAIVCNDTSLPYTYGIVNSENKFILPIKYADIEVLSSSDFVEGLLRISIREEQYGPRKYGFINETGNIVVDFIYDDAEEFSEGLAAVSKNEKYGYIDKIGEMAIPFVYDYAKSFSEGLAAVSKDEKYGYIDKTGETVIPFEYELAYNFSEGVAQVFKGEEYGYSYIDKNGNLVAKSDDSGYYSIVDHYDWSLSNPHVIDGIRINQLGEIVNIDNLNVEPLIVGKNGQYILGFSSNFMTVYRVTITDTYQPVTAISLSKSSTELHLGQSETLTVTYTPADVEDKTVTWTTTNAGVVEVSNGKLIPKAKGTATVTATTPNGKSASCQVTVLAAEYIQDMQVTTTGSTASVRLTTAQVPNGSAVFLAAYDEKGTMLSMTQTQIQNNSAQGRVTITGAMYIRAFVWDGGSLRPITEAERSDL